jgi:predicted enzyme related to lactoylglutathione lyase
MQQLLVNIDVDDLDAAIRFYTQAFELTLGRKLGDDFVELLGGPVPFYLLRNAAGTKPFADAPSGRSYGRHWSPVHLDIVVSDIHAAVERAVAAGARVEHETARHPYGLLCVLSDPFGHGFCFLQFEGRGYDAIAT